MPYIILYSMFIEEKFILQPLIKITMYSKTDNPAPLGLESYRIIGYSGLLDLQFICSQIIFKTETLSNRY